VACRTQPYPPADWRTGTLSLAGAQRKYAADAENTMYRYTTLFGGRLWARGLETQRTEARVKCAVLNRMTQLGMPETVRVG
jgi:hypothetical protein